MGIPTAVKPVPKVKALICPNCGGSVELRGFGRAVNATCIQCLSILDCTTPALQVIQEFQGRERIMPTIPLGSRGKIQGDVWEVIGFQVREMMADGTAYNWNEYVLFNPYKGFKYLSEYNGHWNLVRALPMLPETGMAGNRPTALLSGEKFRHFQHYEASTVYVLGEFPWQIRRGETALLDDFIAPPKMLSREQTGTEKLQEVTWSLGEYTPGADLWAAFKLKGAPPAPQGIYANQPAPANAAGTRRTIWLAFLLLTAFLFTMWFFTEIFAGRHEVFKRSYSFASTGSSTPAEASFVTDPFELKGRTSTVEVTIDTDLDNNSAFFGMALINMDTNSAFDFSRQVSYYHGSDSDGSWTEGGRNNTVLLPSVPPGKYYLRVEPEMENRGSMRYSIRVRRDVPSFGYFGLGLLLLLIPPIFSSFRGVNFEVLRWRESDYSSG